MVFCRMILKRDGFNKSIVRERKYFIQMTIIYWERIKLLVCKLSLAGALKVPRGCVHMGWGAAQLGMLHFYLVCVCVKLGFIIRFS